MVTNWDMDMVLPVTAIVLLSLLNSLGKSIVLREIIALYIVFSCLLMPWIGYEVYNRQNALSLLWGRYMRVDADTYFSYTLPATIGYVLFLCFPLPPSKFRDEGEQLMATISKAREMLTGNQRIGIILLIAGVLTSAVISYLPVSLQFFFNLIYFSSFAGLFYIYFSKPFPFRKLIMLGFGVFILLTALSQGMFTVVVYMGMTIFPFFLLGSKTPLWRKLLLFVAGVFLIALLQSVKPAYRLAVWKNKYQGNQVELFASLIGDKLKKGGQLFNADEFFFIYYRTNQGFNQALVMRYMPAQKAFDNGENLFVSIISSFVPRFIWPDKPEAGGKANMKYYTGIEIIGWATNVGPLGEAYGSFGPTWGILYMMILGLVIRWFFSRVFLIARKTPLILFWLPVLFYQVTYSAENDTLQILNSLIKTSVFLFILYKLFPSVFFPQEATKARLARNSRKALLTSH